MLCFSIGLPSEFADWCNRTVRDLAAQALGTAVPATADTLDEVGAALIGSGAPHLAIASRQPGGALRRALFELDARPVLALADPRTAVFHLMQREGADLATAVRRVASSCAAVLACMAEPGVLVLASDREGVDRAGCAGSIAQHLRLRASKAQIRALAREETPGSPTDEDLGQWWAELGVPGQTLAEGALGAYVQMFASGTLGPIVWQRDLFFVGDAPGEPATRAVDITGRARCLLHGPQIMLPPGSWSAHLGVGFSQEAAGTAFQTEIVAGRQLSRTSLLPSGRGIIEVDLPFSIDDDVDQPVELRISSTRAAFDGRIGLSAVTVTRRRSETADAGAMDLDLG